MNNIKKHKKSNYTIFVEKVQIMPIIQLELLREKLSLMKKVLIPINLSDFIKDKS